MSGAVCADAVPPASTIRAKPIAATPLLHRFSIAALLPVSSEG
jgi:hypothetical protein